MSGWVVPGGAPRREGENGPGAGASAGAGGASAGGGADEQAVSADAPLCDLCGGPMRETHCKLVCDQCGYVRDCSDP